MSLKTTIFQEIPFNSFRGESLTKTLPTDSRTGQKHYTLRNLTSLRGVYEFQHTSNLTNLSSTLFCKIHTLICKSWIGPGPAGHNFERGPPKDHCDQVWF
jgi:hypothetical protein